MYKLILAALLFVFGAFYAFGGCDVQHNPESGFSLLVNEKGILGILFLLIGYMISTEQLKTYWSTYRSKHSFKKQPSQ